MITLSITCTNAAGYIEYKYEDVIDVPNNTLTDIYYYGRRRYGLCAGKIYVDKKNGTTQHVGYIFKQRIDEKLYKYWLTPYIVTYKYLQ